MNGVLAQLVHWREPLVLLRDLADVFVVAFGVYRVLLLLRGTRAVQVGFGLAVLALSYVLAQWLGLATSFAVLDRAGASFLLVVVVIFQNDIRRALMRVGDRPILSRWRRSEETDAVEEVIAAAYQLARRRLGALIVFERDAALEDFVAQGTPLDAQVTRELLYTVFLPAYENPLHDGAVIVRNARVWRAGAFLPLTGNAALDRTVGTRHRAALGISEETDAVVVVVSEERGQVSLCFNGNIVRDLDAPRLRKVLYSMFYPKRQLASLLKAAQEREAQRDSESEARATMTGPQKALGDGGRGRAKPDREGVAQRARKERLEAEARQSVPPSARREG